jgi:hypothetical protein
MRAVGCVKSGLRGVPVVMMIGQMDKARTGFETPANQ